MKYIFLQFDIQDGDRSHTHRVLFTTKCNNVEFAVYWYLYHYWGVKTYNDGKYIYSFGGEIAYRILDYTILTKSEYLYLDSIFK